MVMTGTKITINERNALFGILATEHHNLRDRTINDTIMILLVAKMCISQVKYGKARYSRWKWHSGKKTYKSE